jgi:hypothetical protein
MDQPLLWVLIGALSIFVLALLLAGLGQERGRRREKALATRRKSKIRL